MLYGLRRSEILALRWDDLDVDARTLRIDESVVSPTRGAAWSDAKNERSRRRIPVDDDTVRRPCSAAGASRPPSGSLAGSAWEDHDLIIATRHGRLVLPRSYRPHTGAIGREGRRARLTSHGLRHTAASHMVSKPPTSASSERSPTSSATAPRC